MKKVRKGAASFPIVGIGASAGGLDAFGQLLAALPPESGMAFVLIQHLDPTHASLLSSMLARSTAMPVSEIGDGTRLAPNHVYVIPPNTDVAVSKGQLSLTRREKPSMPVDFFFKSLATDRRAQAIGVILSGTGNDGTQGLEAIKAEGGLAIAQNPASAKFAGMPASAVASGVVDLCLEIPEIAAELGRLSRHPYVAQRDEEGEAAVELPGMQDVFEVVRKAVGVDLGEYKASSVSRRLARRMALRRVDGVPAYLKLLRGDPAEPHGLFQDLLVQVTSFFRDPDVFEMLKARVFPDLVASKRPGDPIRIWVSGCSTGQEAYSVGIALLEFLGERRPEHPVQIFGSDVSYAAIDKVRAGIYPDSVAGEMSPERLRRFFTKVDSGYRIGKAVRESCVFVRHNLGSDPPISRLDLVTCRNVLIYFNQPLQRRVLANFHYALNPNGFLLLGRNESIPGPQDLFTAVDKTEKLYRRSAVTSPVAFATVRRPFQDRLALVAGGTLQPGESPKIDVARHVDNLMLAEYAPAGVLINDRMEVLQFRGRTGRYLEPSPGQPQLNLLKMVRSGLLADVRIALSRALQQGITVRKDIAASDGGAERDCTLVITPVTGLPNRSERLFTVLFEEAAARKAPSVRAAKPAATGGKAANVSKLARELTATKTYLQGLIAEHQEANDALASANEELVSGNEELQSLNEEMETAKEELQATNEELTTLNDELHGRNTELLELNTDLSNVLSSVEIPMLILDAQRRIRRVTPPALRLMNILPGDIGRPIEHIRPNITIANFEELIAQVMDSGAMHELEVEGQEGKWYRVEIRPYKAPDGKVDGTVISVIDIDLLRRSIREAEWARDYAAGVVEAMPTPLVVLDAELAVLSANRAFYHFFDIEAADTVGRSLFQVGKRELDLPHLIGVLREMARANAHLEEVLVEIEVPRRGTRMLLLSARPVRSEVRGAMILLSLEDVTDRTAREEQRAGVLRAAQQAELRAADASAAKDRFLAIVSHELRTPLSSLLLHVELLRQLDHSSPEIPRVTEAIERAALAQARLIDDLLDVSRITHGKLDMEIHTVRLSGVINEAVDLVRPMAKQKTVTLEVNQAEPSPLVLGDAARLRQVVWNLLVNAIKFTPAGGQVTVSVVARDADTTIQVRDTGIGIDPAFLAHVFQPFAQAHDGSARLHGGLGLGLSIVYDVVKLHGGSVRADSDGRDRGTTFTVVLPLLQPDKVAGIAGLPGAAAPAIPNLTSLDGQRVLLVEDDDGTRDPLVTMLAARGADVRGVSSVPEAVSVFGAFRPHVLVSDIGMPGEDGHSLIRKIREMSYSLGGQTPALALTSFARAEDRRKALEAGFDAHLAKPVEFERLATEVLDLCRIGSHRLQGRRATDGP